MNTLVGWGCILHGLFFIVMHELGPRPGHRECGMGKYGVLVHAAMVVLGAMCLVLR